MYVVFLKFSENRHEAGQHMDGHAKWLQAGFDDGIFLMSGSLPPGDGGGILAFNTSRADLESRVNDDPFVIEGVVTPEIREISPSKTDDRLAFLQA